MIKRNLSNILRKRNSIFPFTFNKNISFYFSSTSSDAKINQMDSNLNSNSISRQPLKIVSPIKSKKLHPSYDQPLCIFPKSSLVRINTFGRINLKVKNIKYSSYKLNDTLAVIRKQYLWDAIDRLAGMETMGAKVVLKKLQSFYDSVEEIDGKKLDDGEFREYFIEEAYVGRKLAHKKVIFRGIFT